MIRLENAKPPLQKLTSNRVADQKSWLTNHLVYEGRQLPAPRLKIVQLICLILSAHQNRLKGHADHQTKPCRAFCKDSLPGIWFITVSIAKKINCIHPGLSTENRKVFAPVSTAGNGLFCCQQMCLRMYKHLLYYACTNRYNDMLTFLVSQLTSCPQIRAHKQGVALSCHTAGP